MFPLVLFSGFITFSLCVPRQFIFVNENKTWTEAQSYCRDKYTDLVTVENEQETLQLLNTVNDYNYADLAWIGLYDDLNSWKWTLEDSEFFKEGEKQFRNWYKQEPVNYVEESQCVVMYGETWCATTCDKRLTFICYDGRQNAITSYVWVDQHKTWTEAQSYCRKYHTDLVSVRNEAENQKIQFSIKNNNYYYYYNNIYFFNYYNYYGVWIGLYGTRSWSVQGNSKIRNRRSEEPNSAGNSENCTAVSFIDSDIRTDENCDYDLPFLCYNVSSLTSSRQYHFIFENKSLSEAQTYCRQNYMDLATIDNMTEMNSVMNTVNGSYNGSAWIGLYADVHSWTWSLDDDDFYQEEEREFRNWFHQPDNSGGNEMCVHMNYDGKWFDSSCDSILSFVCFDGNNNTQNYIRIDDRRNWTEAQRYCREYHTDLANVRNQTENQKILEITGGYVWIGLYRNRIWSNGQNTKYQNWGPEITYSEKQPDNGNSVNGQWGNQHCTAVSFRYSGRWTDENCFSNMPFICYSRTCTQSSCISRQYHFISENKSWSEAQTYCRQNYIDLATIDNMTEMNSVMNTVNGSYDGSAWIGQYEDVNSWIWSLGNTELGGGFNSWYVQQSTNWYGQSLCVSLSYYRGWWSEQSCSSSLPFVCYDGRQNASTSYVLVHQNKNWTEAQRYCREHHTDLVSVRNEDENQKIQFLFQTDNIYYSDVWIGLYRTRSWSDQIISAFLFSILQDSDNAKDSEHCTVMSFSDSTWKDENCDYQLPFICYSRLSLRSSRQYHFISESKSWSEAQTYCRQNYMDLATIDDMTETNSVMNAVNGSYNGSAWIGLYDDVNSWTWSLEDDDFYQEEEREFRNWNHQPDNYGGNQLCVYMNYDGSWYDSSCDNSLPFVCYDGRGNTSQRYIWVNQYRSWSEAQRYCRQFYTDLAIVRNETEHQQMLNVTDSYYYYGWIGLYRNRLWSDQSNSSFTYWRPGTPQVYPQPDNGLYTLGLHGAQHCAAVSLQSLGQWTDESCFERLPFFCYGDKYVSGLRVKFMGEETLSQSEIEELITELHEEFIRYGPPGNFAMGLRNYRKIAP